MKNISIAKVFLIINGLLFSFLVVLAGLSIKSYLLNRKLNELQEKRIEIQKLAIDYRESIEEHSNNVRAFVASTNENYENEAEKIHLIREGKLPNEEGVTISLKNRTNQFTFSPAEYQKIDESNEAYQTCYEIHREAINAVKGNFNDGFGNYSIEKEPDIELAKQLVFSDEYEEHLENAIEPIDELIEHIEKRTRKEVTTLKEKNLLFAKFMDIATMVIIVLLVISYMIVRKKVISPIRDLIKYSEKIAIGDVSFNIEKKFDDEIGALTDAFRKMADGLKEKSHFVSEIGNGNYDIKFTQLSNKDIMGKNLLSMRRSLIINREVEEKRKQEDAQRRWTTEGLAMFADILRKDNNNIKKLSQNIIINLVKYLKANQGGLFILNDEKKEKKIELIACYAYDRLRKEKNEINTDEGLIGRVLYEKKAIYITEIPDNYLSITSGLGYATPNSLLLVPLKQNNEVLGVVELASFNKFTENEIDFVETVGESIASTIITTKINERTSKLLMESREQAEVLAAQEEEMRQNIEELQSTQEAFDSKEKEHLEEIDKLSGNLELVEHTLIQCQENNNSLLSAIDNLVLYAELDEKGTYLSVNKQYEVVFGEKTIEKMPGNTFTRYLHADNLISETEFKEMLNTLSEGKTINKTYQLRVQNKNVWLRSSFSPVFDTNSNLHKIVLISLTVDK